ncbi:mitochondrial FAD carrier protein flx1 [Diplodia intermedia]|uniref:Mitochondrial FAD carrier protein flx1 n=1 Tax=Diplodia intermedia TaxID=856260 RepID=A0ABR3TP86_9PEZI
MPAHRLFGLTLMTKLCETPTSIAAFHHRVKILIPPPPVKMFTLSEESKERISKLIDVSRVAIH